MRIRSLDFRSALEQVKMLSPLRLIHDLDYRVILRNILAYGKNSVHDLGGNMSFHDNLAKSAFRDDEPSLQYHGAAQNYADITWLLVFIAVIVWYFLGGKWVLIPFLLAAITTIMSISSSLVCRKLQEYEFGDLQPTGLSPKVERETVEFIRGLKRPEWEKYVGSLATPPGCRKELLRCETGATLAVLDRKKMLGLSIQPLYDSMDTSTSIIIFTSLFQIEMLTQVDNNFLQSVEKTTKDELGPRYSVSASTFKSENGNLAGVKVQVGFNAKGTISPPALTP